MSTLKTTNLQSSDASSSNIILGQGSGGGATISGVTTSSTLRATTGIVTSLTSNQVKIGTETEGNANADNLTIADSTNCGISIRSGTSNTGNVYFSDATSGTGEFAGAVEYGHDTNSLRLHTNSSERVRIDSTGNANISGVTTAAAFAPSVGWLGNRNLIINGAMQVTQRGTQTSVSSATYTLDRWKLLVTSCGAYTVSQLGGSDELINIGLRNSLKVDCTTADASPAAGDLVILQQPMEGLVTNPLCWGQSSGKKAVLSFWAKADVNGWSSGTKDFVVEIQTSDSQEFSTVCQLATAGTWQKFVVNIDAKTSSAIEYGSGESMAVNWWLDAGTNYKGGSAVTGWSAKANSGGVRAAQQTLAIAAHTDNNFYLTGVQLELGEDETPFEQRNYGDELRRCQRYFWQVIQDGSGTAAFVGSTIAYGSSYNIMTVANPVEMRDKCSALTTSGTAADYQLWGNSAVVDLASLPTLRATSSKLQTSVDVPYNVTAGDSRVFRIKASTVAYLGFSAEF